VTKGMTDQVERLRKERDAFDAQLGQLLAAGHGGKHALFVDGSVQGVFASEAEVYEEGLRRFGIDGLFLVVQVAVPAPEPVSLSWEAEPVHGSVRYAVGLGVARSAGQGGVGRA